MQQVVTTSFGQAFARLLHHSARNDALAALRHRAFIASKLIAFCASLAALPFCLFAYGAPEFIDMLLLAGMCVPLCAAGLTIFSGRLESAQLLSACGALATIGCLAWQTDGLNSFLIGWMIVMLVDAALSGSARVFTCALTVAGTLAFALSLAAYNWLLPEPQAPLYTVPALLSVALSFIGNAYALSAGLRLAQAQANEPQADGRFRLMVDYAPDMISLHSRSGNLLFASAAAEKLLGGNEAQLFDRVHVQDRPAFLHVFERAAKENGAVLEFRLQHEGGFKWVEMHCAPLSKGEATPLQFVAVTRQINKYDDAYVGEAVEKINMEHNRMLAGLSHQLRDPLNALLGFAEILSGKTGAPLTTRGKNHYATLIHLAGSHLLDVVNSALDAGSAAAGSFAFHPRRFQPAELIDECLMLMRKQAAKAGVSLRKSPMRAIPEIYADPRACKQILLNLISNGIKFTPAGGSVTLGLSAGAEAVSFVVSDTGIGINEADIDNLGKPFLRLDNSVPGTGLGLSLVKNFAEAQGGSLQISSQVGRGTAVSVTLPRCIADKTGLQTQADAAPLQAAG